MPLINRRIPMTALQTGLFSLLQYQTTPVYDDVPEEATLPYITIEEFSCRGSNAKDTDIWDAKTQLHIWSDYNGKAEINEIANDIATVLSSARIDLSADYFLVLDQDIEEFQAYKVEEFGYHGEITVVVKIQNVGR